MAFNRFNIGSDNEFEKRYIYLEDDDIRLAMSLIDMNSKSFKTQLEEKSQLPLAGTHLDFLRAMLDDILNINGEEINAIETGSKSLLSIYSSEELQYIKDNSDGLKKLRAALNKIIVPRK